MATNNRCKQTGLFYCTIQNLVVTTVLSYSFAFFFLLLHLLYWNEADLAASNNSFSQPICRIEHAHDLQSILLSGLLSNSFIIGLAREIGQALPVLLFHFTLLFFSPFLRFCASSLSIVTVLQTLRTEQNLIT